MITSISLANYRNILSDLGLSAIKSYDWSILLESLI